MAHLPMLSSPSAQIGFNEDSMTLQPKATAAPRMPLTHPLSELVPVSSFRARLPLANRDS